MIVRSPSTGILMVDCLAYLDYLLLEMSGILRGTFTIVPGSKLALAKISLTSSSVTLLIFYSDLHGIPLSRSSLSIWKFTHSFSAN
jgi:hypothetical protein